MKRLAILLALALASLSTVACTADAGDEGTEEETEAVEKSAAALSCSPRNGGCITLERYCQRTGGTMYCRLGGDCWCARSVYSGGTLTAAP